MKANQSEQKSFNLALQCIYFKASFNEIVENNLNKDTHAVIKKPHKILRDCSKLSRLAKYAY